MSEQEKYLTVTALTKYLKKKLEIDPHLKRIYLKGEISNYKHHSSGHMYLTIKDQGAQIRAVMFYPANQSVKFDLENGMKLLFTGHISVYERSGQYQFYISEMLPDGIGALYLAYNQLKDKLSKAGYFEETHKKPIPKYPEKIAILTSATGAAIKDIMTTIKNKYPIVQMIVFPIVVQGEYAKDNIVEAIKKVNQHKDIDTIVLGRGGGSIEDLWAFNEEIVVETIYHSALPIITGIGHETDFTLSDFVADLRAPTPTGAANAAVPSLNEFALLLNKYQQNLLSLLKNIHSQKKHQLNTLKHNYILQKPEQIFRNKHIYIDQLHNQLDDKMVYQFKQRSLQFEKLSYKLMQHSPIKRMKGSKETLAHLSSSLSKNYERILTVRQHRIVSQIDKLQLLNPLDTMKRGYAILYNQSQHVISRTDQVEAKEKLDIQLTDGRINCTVNTIRKEEG